MSLGQELADFRTAFEAAAPPGRATLYSAKIEELRREFLLERVVKVGDRVDDFCLPDARGADVSLYQMLKDGPAILCFYRGGWCPYCNIQLRAYQRVLPEIAAWKGQLAAISPQLPDGTLSTAERNELQFPVLSDVRNEVARRFGLVYVLAQEIRSALWANGKALPPINGDESWELQVPATFVIAQDGRVALSFVEVDYRIRLEPELILNCLRLLAVEPS
jgi:peroxiredoxin